MRRFEQLVAGVVLAFLALGLALLPLLTPPFTRLLEDRYGQAAEAGLSSAQALSIAEQTRRYVVSGRGELPTESAEKPGFDAESIAHLDDVRLVMRGARVATSVLAVIALAWVLARRRDPARVCGALRSAAAILGGSLVLALFVSLTDFDAFFTAFHSLFFAPGTWTFPEDSLLIRLFPEMFWVIAGASWAVLTVVVGALYGTLGVLLGKRTAC